MTDREQARIDHVARAILESLGGEPFTDEDWQVILTDEIERPFLDDCRKAARVAIAAADCVTGVLQ